MTMTALLTDKNSLGHIVHWQVPADDDQAHWLAEETHDGALHFHRLH